MSTQPPPSRGKVKRPPGSKPSVRAPSKPKPKGPPPSKTGLPKQKPRSRPPPSKSKPPPKPKSSVRPPPTSKSIKPPPPKAHSTVGPPPKPKSSVAPPPKSKSKRPPPKPKSSVGPPKPKHITHEPPKPKSREPPKPKSREPPKPKSREPPKPKSREPPKPKSRGPPPPSISSPPVDPPSDSFLDLPPPIEADIDLPPPIMDLSDIPPPIEFSSDLPPPITEVSIPEIAPETAPEPKQTSVQVPSSPATAPPPSQTGSAPPPSSDDGTNSVKTVRYVSAHGKERSTVDTSDETVLLETYGYQVSKKTKKNQTKFVWRKKYMRLIRHADPKKHGIYAYINDTTALSNENDTIILDVRPYRKYPVTDSIDSGEAGPKKTRPNCFKIHFFGKEPFILSVGDVDSGIWVAAIREMINSQIPDDKYELRSPVDPSWRQKAHLHIASSTTSNKTGENNNTWKRVENNGTVYYYNVSTRETSWSFPPNAIIIN